MLSGAHQNGMPGYASSIKSVFKKLSIVENFKNPKNSTKHQKNVKISSRFTVLFRLKATVHNSKVVIFHETLPLT